MFGKHYTRVSALLKNLEERRANGWKLHLATETGPKTLDAVRREVEEGEGDDRKEDKKVAKKSAIPLIDGEKIFQDVFAKYEKGTIVREGSENPITYDQDHIFSDLRKLLRVPDQTEGWGAFLRVVADAKKEPVNKRIEILKMTLGTELFHYVDFKTGFEKTFHVIIEIYVEIGRLRV